MYPTPQARPRGASRRRIADHQARRCDVVTHAAPGLDSEIVKAFVSAAGALHARHLEENPEIAALIAQASSFTVPGGKGSAA